MRLVPTVFVVSRRQPRANSQLRGELTGSGSSLGMQVTTLAGLGRAGFKDGKGGAAAFSEPGGLAVAPNGAGGHPTTYSLLCAAAAKVLLSLRSSTPPPPKRTLPYVCPRTGDVIIADTNNGAIRVFHPATGVVDTLDMSSVPKADTGASAAADAEQQQASQAPAGAAVRVFRGAKHTAVHGRSHQRRC